MTDTRLLYSITDAAELLSIGKRTMEDLVREGVVETVLIRRRRLVPAEALADYVERLKASA